MEKITTLVRAWERGALYTMGSCTWFLWPPWGSL